MKLRLVLDVEFETKSTAEEVQFSVPQVVAEMVTNEFKGKMTRMKAEIEELDYPEVDIEKL